MPTFPPDEILETHRRYIDTRVRIDAGELTWGALADFFVEDATFIDPAWGRFDGLDNIVKFWLESIATSRTGLSRTSGRLLTASPHYGLAEPSARKARRRHVLSGARNVSASLCR